MILSTLDKSRKGGAYEQIPSLVLGQRWTPQLNSRNMMKVVLCVWIEPYIENDLSFCVWPVHTPTTSKEVLTLSASTSPLPYTGNKSCIVNTILSVMPKHTVYIDPCMGSAEVFFRMRLPTGLPVALMRTAQCIKRRSIKNISLHCLMAVMNRRSCWTPST